ncbi:hypothetical protein NKI41_32230 [Mesorhizobium sp. M0601]|uniref:hypothetical protein n=1 Tax=Mesorhizobium sp. M0601 TaxID=2956969 RepID=UPI003339FE65
MQAMDKAMLQDVFLKGLSPARRRQDGVETPRTQSLRIDRSTRTGPGAKRPY